MLGLGPTIILSLVLTFMVNTVTAGSGGKAEPSCKDCTAKIDDCKKTCKPDLSTWTCEFNCNCQVAKDNAFCRESCEIAGPESGCEDF